MRTQLKKKTHMQESAYSSDFHEAHTKQMFRNMDAAVFHCSLGEKRDIKLLQSIFSLNYMMKLLSPVRKKRHLTPSSGLVRECDT